MARLIRVLPWRALLACVATSTAFAAGQDGGAAPVERSVASVEVAADATGLVAWAGTLDAEHRHAGAVLRASRSTGTEGLAACRTKLAARGVAALPAWLDILERERVPEARPDDAPQILSEPQRALLMSAMATLPAKALRAESATRLARRPDDPALQLAALRVLAVCGERGDLRGLVDLVPRKHADGAQTRQQDALGPPTRAGRDALREAVAAIVLRDQRAFAALEAVVLAADEPVARTFLEAVSSARTTRAVPLFVRVAARRPELGLAMACMVPRTGGALDEGEDAAFVALAWRAIPDARVEEQVGWLAAIGALDDGSSCAELVALLEGDEDGRTRAAAQTALRRIVGSDLVQPARWRRWLEDEQAWHDSARPDLRAALAQDAAGPALQALVQYRTRRTRRAALAEDVAAALAHPVAEVRSLACDVLQELGTKGTAPRLEALLDDEHQAVRAAAQVALSRLLADIPAAERKTLGLEERLVP
ncbi:MAG: hypothetical protein ACK57N_06140 [Planctomycetia bacterium]